MHVVEDIGPLVDVDSSLDCIESTDDIDTIAYQLMLRSPIVQKQKDLFEETNLIHDDGIPLLLCSVILKWILITLMFVKFPIYCR